MELLREIGRAKESISLASPFLSLSIAKEIADNADPQTHRRLVTALVSGSVQARALNPAALLHLHERGWEIRSIVNLHAKVSIVDSRWALAGSGNLTNAGLGAAERGNLELGVILAPDQVLEAAAIYERWWGEAEVVSAAQIADFAAMAPARSEGDPEVGVGPVLKIGSPVELGELLSGGEPERRYWVKANYDKAGEDGRAWWHRGFISDWRRASYAKGDLIVLYLGAAYEGPSCCPAIVRVRRPAERDPQFIALQDDAEAAERWPWATLTEVVHEVPVEQGISLGVFGVTPRALESGYKELSEEQFETAARHLLREDS